MDSLTADSEHWQKVAHQRPKILPEIEFEQQHYRGECWYLLYNRVSGRCFRFSADCYRFISQLDGSRTLAQIEQELRQGDPEVDERLHYLQLLSQLQQAGAVSIGHKQQGETTEKSTTRSGGWWRSLRNPLAIRIPLFNPTSLLNTLMPLVRRLASPVLYWGWLMLLLISLGQLFVHSSQLQMSSVEALFNQQNLLLLWLIFPLTKAAHELGHAVVTRYYGGDVKEMGIVIMAAIPVPYVDASSASAFVDKGRRMKVDAAGIAVDLTVAALAMQVWLYAEQGWLTALAFSLMLICGFSTLAINGNPLMRFDGYYLLSDWLDIPNLAPRSGRYLIWLYLSKLVGVADLGSPTQDRSEARWLAGYGVLSFCYRLALLSWLAFMAAEISILLGALLAIWVLVVHLLRPLMRGVLYLLISPGVAAKRGRAVTSVTCIATLLVIVLFVLPVPYKVNAQGVLWLPTESRVLAAGDGYVDSVITASGQKVAEGDLLLELIDPELATERGVELARMRELRAQYQASVRDDRPQADLIATEIKHLQERIDLFDEREAALVVTSQSQGTYIQRREDRWLGRFVKQGELLGYIVPESVKRVRAVVRQQDTELLAGEITGVKVLFPGPELKAYDARVISQQPAATTNLPSRALGTLGGGEIVADPADPSGMTAIDKFLLLELELAMPASGRESGVRADVRFDLANQPIGVQWWREIRQLFLQRLQY